MTRSRWLGCMAVAVAALLGMASAANAAEWIPGHYGPGGMWHPGHWAGVGPRPGPPPEAIEAPPGYRPGRVWVPGHYNGPIWAPGHWAER